MTDFLEEVLNVSQTIGSLGLIWFDLGVLEDYSKYLLRFMAYFNFRHTDPRLTFSLFDILRLEIVSNDLEFPTVDGRT